MDSCRDWIITGSGFDSKLEKQYKELGVKLIKLQEAQINIHEMLKVIGEMGITSLFVEGGSEVHGSFLKEGAFQQVITYIAPKLIGGKLAPTYFGGEGFETMDQVVSLKIKEVDRIGDDLRIIAEPK